jgi:hypothetical protein
MARQAESTVKGTYVYCVVPASAAEKAGALGSSIDKAPPLRTLRADGLVAVVSDALRDEYDPSRANIGAHERVVQGAFDRGDLLPMRFGTVARGDDAIQQFLHDKHGELEQSLARLHGRVELALKVLSNRDEVLRRILTENDDIRSLRDALAGQPPEQTRDQRVELGRMTTEAMERRRKEDADRILERLRSKAEDVDEQKLLSDTMVLNAAFLVDKNAVEAFDAAVNALAAEERGRLTFKYVGPLPPYSFVKIVVPKEE